jgi:hypothetical protein
MAANELNNHRAYVKKAAERGHGEENGRVVVEFTVR